MRHPAFIARTVLVQNGDVDRALRMVNRLMGEEGLFEQYRLTRYYEKPYKTRARINFERCKAIYNEDMTRKVNFLIRTNRHDPYPGCS